MNRQLLVFALAMSACVVHGGRFLAETGQYEDVSSSRLDDGGVVEARDQFLVVRDLGQSLSVAVYGTFGSKADGGTQVRLTTRSIDGWILDDGLRVFPIGVRAGEIWEEPVPDAGCTLVATATAVSMTSITISRSTKCSWGVDQYSEERWELDRGMVDFRLGPDARLRAFRVGPIPHQ